MKKGISIFVLFCLCTNLSAQQSIEVGINNGFSTYLGDLQPKNFTFNQSDFVVGLQGRYNFNARWAGRFSANYGQIRGADRLTKEASLIARNLSFKSPIFEINIIGEFNLLNFGSHKENLQSRKYYKFTPYVFGGVNVFRFNPQGNYNGRWYDLQPLGTEGQGVPLSGKSKYALTQIGLPLGLGVKYELKPNIILSFEFGWRKTFTDYLDDVSGDYYNLSDIATTNGQLASTIAFRGDELSTYNGRIPSTGTQRGDSENDDWYLMNTFTVAYKIFKSRNGNFHRRIDN